MMIRRCCCMFAEVKFTDNPETAKAKSALQVVCAEDLNEKAIKVSNSSVNIFFIKIF